MAQIPLPERGQPLDVGYISRLAQAINDISKDVSPARYDYVTVDTKDAGPQNKKIGEVRVLGVIKNITSTDKSVLAGEAISFTHSFAGEFKFPPIVTATAVNVGSTPAGGNLIVVLKEPTTSGISGEVRFNDSGKVSVNVNLIIIGVPN
jgi:hypothetical protein